MCIKPLILNFRPCSINHKSKKLILKSQCPLLKKIGRLLILQKMNFLSRFLKKTLAVQKKLTISMLDFRSIGRKGINTKTL